MSAAKAVRLPTATYEAVRLLAGDEPMHTVIAEAVEKLRRERFMDEVNGEIWLTNLDPTIGREQARIHPRPSRARRHHPDH